MEKVTHIIPLIQNCLTDSQDEWRRLVGIRLVDDFAEVLGVDLIQGWLMQELLPLQEDPVFKVRRELVFRMQKISNVIGEGFFVGVVMPVFKKLASDEIWSVRKACVEVLPEMTLLSSEKVRNQ